MAVRHLKPMIRDQLAEPAYFNMYRQGDTVWYGELHHSRHNADKVGAHPINGKRIACIRVIPKPRLTPKWE